MENKMLKSNCCTIFILITTLLFNTCLAEINESSKPNIVFIMTDDLGYGDISCYNPGSKINTPNIDRLASQGIKFTDAHSPSAVCTPTRYGLLTGRYPVRAPKEYLGPLMGAQATHQDLHLEPEEVTRIHNVREGSMDAMKSRLFADKVLEDLLKKAIICKAEKIK